VRRGARWRTAIAYLLLEYGPNVLDLNLSIPRAMRLEGELRIAALPGNSGLTPVVSLAAYSLLFAAAAREALLERWMGCRAGIFPDLDDMVVSFAPVGPLPLSGRPGDAKLAIRKYMQGVRPEALVCPTISNSSSASMASHRSTK